MLRSLRVPCSAVAVIAAVAAGASVLPDRAGAPRAASQEQRTAPARAARTAEPGRDAAATGQPPSSPAPSPPPSPPATSPARHAGAGTDIFKGLGAWLDQFDYGLRPSRVVPTMRRNGVRTVYLQTGYSGYRSAVDPDVGPWLLAVHRAGMKAVGWYLPDYANPRWDVRRTLAIERYSYRGHRFDGIGIDIESKRRVKGARWNRHVRAHAAAARAALGRGYPLAAITPTPLQMRVAPGFWAGFPWRSLARTTDAFLLMSYWSDRRGCPRVPHHCAYGFTGLNVSLTRRLAGRSKALVHIIGGIGDSITRAQLADFARAARRADADGASIYDVATTKPSFWRVLRRLKDLG